MQLETLKEKALKEIGEEEADIFEAHLTMLKDPMLVDDINNNIEKRKKAEVAIELARLKIEQMFKAIPDAYIQARAADVNDVTRRLIRIILGIEEKTLSSIEEPVIIIAEDLTPSDTVGLSKNVKGIVTEIGSETSHAAIIAKAMGLPAMVGVEGALDDLSQAKMVILDTVDNKIIIEPSERLLNDYYMKRSELEKEKRTSKVT